jgi:hypothetical protein
MKHTTQLCDEQRQPDSNRSKECGFVLLRCEHDDSENQLGTQEHLNEETLSD